MDRARVVFLSSLISVSVVDAVVATSHDTSSCRKFVLYFLLNSRFPSLPNKVKMFFGLPKYIHYIPLQDAHRNGLCVCACVCHTDAYYY